MSTEQDIIIELRNHVMNLYEKKNSELKDLKGIPGDGIIKHHEICLKAREMAAVAECLNIIYNFEHKLVGGDFHD